MVGGGGWRLTGCGRGVDGGDGEEDRDRGGWEVHRGWIGEWTSVDECGQTGSGHVSTSFGRRKCGWGVDPKRNLTPNKRRRPPQGREDGGLPLECPVPAKGWYSESGTEGRGGRLDSDPSEEDKVLGVSRATQGQGTPRRRKRPAGSGGCPLCRQDLSGGSLRKRQPGTGPGRSSEGEEQTVSHRETGVLDPTAGGGRDRLVTTPVWFPTVGGRGSRAGSGCQSGPLDPRRRPTHSPWASGNRPGRGQDPRDSPTTPGRRRATEGTPVCTPRPSPRRRTSTGAQSEPIPSQWDCRGSGHGPLLWSVLFGRDLYVWVTTRTGGGFSRRGLGGEGPVPTPGPPSVSGPPSVPSIPTRSPPRTEGRRGWGSGLAPPESPGRTWKDG